MGFANDFSWAGVFKAFLSLLGIDVLELLAALFRLVQRIIPIEAQPGIYEVLERDIRLELRDTKGKEAIFFKRQRVRFLQDNIIAWEDKAWGDVSRSATPAKYVHRGLGR
jgi:hypothetical protein